MPVVLISTIVAPEHMGQGFTRGTKHGFIVLLHNVPATEPT